MKNKLISTSLPPITWAVDNEGNIHFTLTSSGMTKEQWKEHFESRGIPLFDWGRDVLRQANQANENSTKGFVYQVVIRPGNNIGPGARIDRKLRLYATEKGWNEPHWEIACLIRDNFTDEQLKQMGLLWIVVMHKIIRISGGHPFLLGLDCELSSNNCLTAHYVKSVNDWNTRGGFAWVLP